MPRNLNQSVFTKVLQEYGESVKKTLYIFLENAVKYRLRVFVQQAREGTGCMNKKSVMLTVVLLLVVAAPGCALENDVSGVVYDETGQGVSGVTLIVSSYESGTVETDEDGRWVFTLSNKVTVTPMKEGYIFEPESITVYQGGEELRFKARRQACSITIQNSEEEGAFIVPSPGIQTYNFGEVINLKVSKLPSWLHFDKWCIRKVDEQGQSILEWTDGRKVTSLSVNGDYVIAAVFTSDFAGGSGTEENPFLIETAEQLDRVRHYLDKHFKLTADIDLSVSPWNEGQGWEPIGRYYEKGHVDNLPFTGTFQGNGYAIFNLFIDRPAASGVGLFAHTCGAQLCEVTLEDVNVEGGSFVGGLVGAHYDSSESAFCSVSGHVSGDEFVGGLVGISYGSTIRFCCSDSIIQGSKLIGGLVGGSNNYSDAYFDTTISHSGAVGSVIGESSVGGLVGINDGLISFGHSESSVTGKEEAGGLVGSNYGCVEKSHARGNVTGTTNLGGLVGINYPWGLITSCFAAGTVDGTGDFVGGLAGVNLSIIRGSRGRGNTKGMNYVGGLIGLNSGNGKTSEGGTIEDSSASGMVEGEGGVGGLVGCSTHAAISRSYSNGSVMGIYFVGGLVGLDQTSLIKACFSSGSVTGQHETVAVGGLTGMSDGSNIYDSYARGDVEGRIGVGGFVGVISGTTLVNRCYAVGRVVGDLFVGAFSGDGIGGTVNAYFDSCRASQESPGDVIKPRTTSQMMMKSTFKGWDFDECWFIKEGQDYPILRWQMDSD